MEFGMFLTKYLGKPYDEADCWDIIKLFYVKVMGKEMDLGLNYGKPGQDREYREKISQVIELERCKFIQVETPIFGDIIVFNILGLPAHVGVYIGENKFMHTLRETGCCVDTLARWGKKARGYYRWPN